MPKKTWPPRFGAPTDLKNQPCLLTVCENGVPPFSPMNRIFATGKSGNDMKWYGVSIWVCLKIVYPYTQWLMIIIPTKWLQLGVYPIFRHTHLSAHPSSKYGTPSHHPIFILVPGGSTRRDASQCSDPFRPRSAKGYFLVGPPPITWPIAGE